MQRARTKTALGWPQVASGGLVGAQRDGNACANGPPQRALPILRGCLPRRARRFPCRRRLRPSARFHPHRLLRRHGHRRHQVPRRQPPLPPSLQTTAPAGGSPLRPVRLRATSATKHWAMVPTIAARATARRRPTAASAPSRASARPTSKLRSPPSSPTIFLRLGSCGLDSTRILPGRPSLMGAGTTGLQAVARPLPTGAPIGQTTPHKTQTKPAPCSTRSRYLVPQVR